MEAKELVPFTPPQPLSLASQSFNVMDIGKLLAQSGYFSDVKDMSQAVAKILAGQELGIGPTTSLTSVFIVQGRPSYSANIIAAVIKRSGIYNYKIIELDNTKCVLEFYEHGKALKPLSTFTIEDARTAELLTGKNAHSWKHYPRNMLFARALTNGQKWHCPDVAGGLPLYTPEELGAAVNREGEVISARLAIESQPRPFSEAPNSGSLTHTTKSEPFTFQPDNPYIGEVSRLVPVQTIMNPDTLKTKRKPGVISIQTEHGELSAFFYERPQCLKDVENWLSIVGLPGKLTFEAKSDKAGTGTYWYVKEFEFVYPDEQTTNPQDLPGDGQEPEEGEAA